ncbi:AhpC/TSA antioxidant enzyme-domain-containing protein [Leptodontidium sp. MPI-SDFR-AT-0119]|nr:AhpC/TSA antioxidant enzyme-domain-containing protein [Leptodontidium sp. MPI-SDFR-AT-0119]
MSQPSLLKFSHSIPEEQTLSESYALPVYSHDGRSTPFGELVSGDGVVAVIAIFVRHFFCACDQDYISSLPPHITPDTLSTLPSGPARLVVIGCGDPSRILPYTTETSCEFPIFTDPTCRLHERLRMKRSLAGSSKTTYMKHSLFGLIMSSVRQMIWSGFGAFKGGDYSQNGGEWIFRAGKCVWVHRMETTSDHVPAEELIRVLREIGD